MERAPLTPPTHLPSLPGVYLFKNAQGTVLYVGKAKNLKKRVASYFVTSYAVTSHVVTSHPHTQTDLKTIALTTLSTKIDHIVTKTEIEAMLLEARLIQSYQPQYNILLKTGQPYLYLLFTHTKRPELKLVRTKKQKGTYFGPFLEKGHARRVHNFLVKTFQLKLCNKKIPNGCLYYHLNACAGSCKDDFDEQSYCSRLALAKQALQKGHKAFLNDLKTQIDTANTKLNFEKSQELHAYHQAFERVFVSLQTHFSSKEKSLSHKHIWIWAQDDNTLFLFDEVSGITKQKRSFYLPFDHPQTYVERYYHTHDCPHLIVTDFTLASQNTIEQFLQQWHKKPFPVTITSNPPRGHLHNLVALATTHANQALEKQKTLGTTLQSLLKLPTPPTTIDCFDISHKQGMHMVGACVRFTNGKPNKNKFRRFKIKTVDHQDDYACLAKIVSRRYRNTAELPDLILIDGGKGQLNAIKDLFPQTPCASLAKREETIFSNKLPEGKKITATTIAGQTLIALRDYTHHFAITYHRTLIKPK